MSRHTLRTHTQNVLTKLGVHSKMDAIVAAIRFGKVRTVQVSPAEDREPENVWARSARFAVQRVLAAPPAVLLELDPVAVVHPVLDRVVVPPLAVGAGERDLGRLPSFFAIALSSTSRSW